MVIRTRFAPSPTGYLHIGGLRSALYSYFFARKHHGQFLLRVEDTDQSRYVPGAVENLIKVLGQVGVDYDEGPIIKDDGTLGEKGEFGPYTQSSRLALYQEHAKLLVERGSAYYCFCSEERLETMHKELALAKLPPKYDRTCLRLTPEEIQAKLAAGEKYVIRLRIPEGTSEFDDLIRGHIKFDNAEVDDPIILKSDGFPTYHLAVVVDDHFMKITHAFRAEEWLPSTPKHLVIYKALGWEIPFFAHLPQVLNKDKKKLSKRQGDVSVEDFLKKGYLPAALNNYMALCGFNPKADQEIYSMAEFIELFDIEKVNKAGAVFDVEKLNWMNSQYIHKTSVDELTTLCLPYLAEAGKTFSPELIKKICTVERERLVLLSDIVEKVDSYQKLPDYAAELLIWKKSSRPGGAGSGFAGEEALEQLKKIIPLFETLNLSSVELIEAAIREYIVSNNLQNGAVLWPLRAALSGAAASPSPFELIWVLGKEESLNRLNHAVQLLSA
ncbi:MAG: glutamate--tRNA ligase [Patescibacteria group bacterium]|jgi:nondiscriminating glutamyl-tRNA synthetase